MDGQCTDNTYIDSAQITYGRTAHRIRTDGRRTDNTWTEGAEMKDGRYAPTTHKTDSTQTTYEKEITQKTLGPTAHRQYTDKTPQSQHAKQKDTTQDG